MGNNQFTRRAAGTSSSRSDHPVITQAMIRQLAIGQDQTKTHYALREDIISLLKQGAVIEPGDLGLAPRCVQEKRLTVTKLLRILESDEIRRLQSLVEPTERYYLTVTGRSRADKPARRPRPKTQRTSGTDHIPWYEE